MSTLSTQFILNRLRKVVASSLLAPMLLLLALLSPQDARADVCTAAMTDISFGNVSPISGQDYLASGTLSITCTFVILQGNIILLPTISACASLGAGSGAIDVNARSLSHGAVRIPFNLYREPTYSLANVWGGYVDKTAITSVFAGLLAIGTNTQTYPVYAKIAAADLAGAATVANADTTYGTDFTGAGTLNYTSASILVLNCHLSGTVAPFSFNVRANVVNDCRINTTPVAFGSQGILNTTTRAVGSVVIKCTASNAYRIALNGGTVSQLSHARKMKNPVTGETVDYRLSASLDGPEWGDGTSGTSTYDATGTGATQTVSIYGRVPSQRTPSPGSYADKVTATIYF